MLEHTNLILLALLALAFAIYAVKASQKKADPETYAVAGRNVGVLALTATLVMTELNTATLLSFSSLGFIAGIKALWLPAVFLFGLLFYALTVAKKWKNFNGYSVVDYFIERFGRRVGLLTALFLMTAMLGFSAVYLKSLTFLFENLMPGTSYWIISAYIVLITLFFVIRKGLVSIIKMDLFAFAIVLIALPIILFKLWDNTQFGNPVPNGIPLSNNFLFSLIPLTMFSYILAPWYGQRIFAAKNSKVAVTSVLLSAGFVFILYSVGVLICYMLALKGAPLSDPQQAFPYALDLSLKQFMYPGGYILLFLISSTTLTGVWNAMSNIVIEFLPNPRNRNLNIPTTLLCAAITYVLANALVDNILNKMILANVPVVALSFALLAGFYWARVSRAGVYISIIVGLFAGTYSYTQFGDAGIYTYYWAFWGIPAIFISGILGSLLLPDRALKPVRV